MRIALVGAGGMGTCHYMNYRHIEGAQVVVGHLRTAQQVDEPRTVGYRCGAAGCQQGVEGVAAGCAGAGQPPDLPVYGGIFLLYGTEPLL